jgi:hypothetical protein
LKPARAAGALTETLNNIAVLEFPIHLIPGVGIPMARFGEDRADHRASLGDFEPFAREPGDDSADIYIPTMMVLEYDERDRLCYLQVANNFAAVYLDGLQLSDEPLDQIREAMRLRGHEPVTVSNVDFYPELGLRLGFSWTDLGGPEEDLEGELVREISLIQEETDLEDLQRRIRNREW